MSWSRVFQMKGARMRRRRRGSRTGMSGPLRGGAQHAGNGAGKPVPAFELRGGGCAPFPGEPVELGLAVVLGRAPFRGDQPLLFHSVQRGIERAFFDPEDVFGQLVDASGDAVAMVGPGAEAFEDEEVERALQKVDAADGHACDSALDRLGKPTEMLRLFPRWSG